MFKILFTLLICLTISSCVVSKKKYIALEQELTQIKSDLRDDDKDGVPNYVDLEQNTDSLANVDSKGRTVKIIKVVDIDGDGVLDVDDFCPTIKGVSAANGCPDKDGDGVYDFVDKCPNTAGLKKDEGCPKLKEEDKKGIKDNGGNLKPIRFKDKTLTFDSISKVEIDEYLNTILKLLNEHPEYTIEVSGHTDNLGDSLKNIKISEKRALKIKNLLIKKGLDKRRISVVALGSSKPIAINSSEKGRAYNNCVRFYINFKEE